MNLQLVTENLLSAPILFFMLGALAAWVRSDLDIPAPIPRILSLYLLCGIGLRGGAELAHGGLGGGTIGVLAVCVVASAAIPLWCYMLLRRRLGADDAAAIAATYGSVSAVTFITACGFLTQQGVSYGGHMVAAMALMESPAIVVGILLARRGGLWGARATDASSHGFTPQSSTWTGILRESFLNGAVLLLLGSLLIGLIVGSKGLTELKPFIIDPFKGVLCLFLLDMGLVAARRIGDLRRFGVFLVVFAIVAPVIHALIGIAASRLLGLGAGDALLLTILLGSASYIAVPAAMRLSIPNANPGLFVPMALGVTFPLNILFGIPFYMSIIRACAN